MKEKVVLAYSGGLDTSVILKWLIESSGWTREEIAKRLNTSAQNIEKMD